MAFSASAPSDVRTASSLRDSKLSSVRINGKPNKLSFGSSSRRRRGRDPCLKVTKAVLDNRKPSIGSNESSEPARILLERLFARTQKLEEHMSQDSRLSRDVDQLGLNLETLEADLMAALDALRKKEEEFQDAEKTVVLENVELRLAKTELERREREDSDARQKYRKIEEELKVANLDLDSRAREIEGLKARLGEMDENVGAARSALARKEDEIERVSSELLKKSDEAERIDSKLKSKAQLLNQANEVVKGQETEIQALRKAIGEKEEELEAELALRRVEEAKLKAAESKLEKQTLDWLQVREEMKKLADEVGKHAKVTMEDFQRVKRLLGDARSELVSSQKSLSLSRQKMEEQERAVGNRLAELEEQKKNVMSYMVSLEDAHKEIESERAKLNLAEARNDKLEGDLLKERKSVSDLDTQLRKERSALQKSVYEVSSFKTQLDQKSAEFEKTQSLLRVKESELVDAKLEIQNLKSTKASLERVLVEKNLEIVDAKKKLDVLSNEISELRMLLNSKETQLIQATRLLKEKDEQLGIVQNELDHTKQKAFEAENVVERIVELTNKLVITIKEEDYMFDDASHELLQKPFGEPSKEITMQKRQLETELEMTKESLRRKEMDVLIAQRSLAVKDEELKLILERSDEKERELKKMKDEVEQDAADLRKLYALAQERMGEKTVGDLAIEKLQTEVVQLEAEAAMNALQKLSEMSRELLNGATLSADIESDFSFSTGEKSDFRNNLLEENKESFEVVKTEVVRLSALTEELLKDARTASLGANREPVTA